MLFERVSVSRPGACARGWIADPDGVYHEAHRGFGGQTRTADRLLQEPAFARVERIGWVTSLAASRRGRGVGAEALQSLLERFDDANVDFVGLIAVPDDLSYLPRLINYYRRFGFNIVADDEGYPVMVRLSPH